MNSLFFGLLIVAALGSGLMAGLFCTFSNFAMRALSSIPPAKGISAMQSINIVIVNPVFLSVFLGTAAVSLAAVVLGILNLGIAGSAWALLGGALYLAGSIAVTGIFNVPLNNKLAAVDADSDDSVSVWHDYVARWTRWNHVRSISTLASTAAFIVAIDSFQIPA